MLQQVNMLNNVLVLQPSNSTKFCADEGNKVKCNRPHTKAWEHFTAYPLGNDKYALKGRGPGNNKWCADDSSGIRCNRPHVKGWEKFTIQPIGITNDGKKQYEIKGGRRNQYCYVDGYNEIKCNRATRDTVNKSTTFTGYVALNEDCIESKFKSCNAL